MLLRSRSHPLSTRRTPSGRSGSTCRLGSLFTDANSARPADSGRQRFKKPAKPAFLECLDHLPLIRLRFETGLEGLVWAANIFGTQSFSTSSCHGNESPPLHQLLLLVWRVAELEARNLKPRSLSPATCSSASAKWLNLTCPHSLPRKRQTVISPPRTPARTRRLREVFRKAAFDAQRFSRRFRHVLTTCSSVMEARGRFYRTDDEKYTLPRPSGPPASATQPLSGASPPRPPAAKNPAREDVIRKTCHRKTAPHGGGQNEPSSPRKILPLLPAAGTKHAGTNPPAPCSSPSPRSWPTLLFGAVLVSLWAPAIVPFAP